MDDEAKRVLAHPLNEDLARTHAKKLGIEVQITSLCPPGTIYVFDPSALFDPENDRRA
jgi:hypothetical protein